MSTLAVDLTAVDKRDYQAPEHISRPWLRRYSKFVCFSVVVLIFKGALVTSNNAGLAVPDWPTSFGENMFLFPPSKWTGIIFFEHVHRLVASAVGFFTLILTAWILTVEKRSWVKGLAILALAAVILQGILGGLTVLFLLPTSVSVAHAVLGQTFLVITIILAYSQSVELQRRIENSSVEDSGLFKAGIIFFAVVYLQLILGAWMRHSEAGLAILDFPRMGGMLWPSFDQNMLNVINEARAKLLLPPVEIAQVLIHFAHRLGALAVLIAGIGLFLAAIKKGSALYQIRKTGSLIVAIILLQSFLGIYTVLSGKHPIVTSLHVVSGALLLGMAALFLLRGYIFSENSNFN